MPAGLDLLLTLADVKAWKPTVHTGQQLGEESVEDVADLAGNNAGTNSGTGSEKENLDASGSSED